MIKFVMRAIIFCIPIAKYRRKIRGKIISAIEKYEQKLKLKTFGNYHPICDFKNHEIAKKSVLVLEFNNFHGITLPGYIHYFSKLGYNVDCFLRYGQNTKWKPLCRLKDKYKAFVGDEFELKKNLSLEKIKQYDFVFVNTTFYYGILAPYPKGESVFNLIENVPCGKYGNFIIEHNYEPYVKKYHEEKYIKNGNLFTLLGFRGTKMLSSSYVGDVELTPKNNNKVKFLSIGSIHPSNKNIKLLFDACEKLINSGIKNFEVQIIGSGPIDGFPKQLRHYIKMYKNLTYEEMFKAIEKGDFILNLFDPENKDHYKYLDNWATGGSILFYAFAKIPLMHKFYSKPYFLNDDNAIIYTDLAKGMETAIQMTNEEYKKRQSELFNLVQNLQEESLENLKKQIESMKEIKKGKK